MAIEEPSAPRVSMGMPVYNGERYLEEALRSLLSQTFQDFELLISDNASTDRTSSICRDYAAMDKRISYIRNAVNVGFCRNQNRVYELASGRYFLLTHHDDVRSPEYLTRTVAVLEADAALVVCYTGTRDIDESGNFLPRVDPELRLDSPDPRVRFRDIIRMDHINEADFGLTRMQTLRRTRLHGDYADSDRVLLAELLLYGAFHKIPEDLFFRRSHALQSTAIATDRVSRTIWFNPARKGELLFPHFRQFTEYLAVLRRAPISLGDRLWCFGEMLRWLNTNRRRLRGDVVIAAKQVLRPLYYFLTSRAE